jgi:proteasome accessory factor B
MSSKKKTRTTPADTPLLRQWILLRILSSRWTGATIDELAQELETSPKTVRRDLCLFKRLGLPITEIREAHGRKRLRLEPRGATPPPGFAFDEALALYLSRRLLDPIAGSPFWDAAQRAFRKIRAMFSPDALHYVERFGALFYPTTAGVSDYSGKSQLIDRLMIGIEDQRAVDITYTSLRVRSPQRYRIHPYGMIYHHGSLYVVGYSTLHKEIRHWKVDRMEDVEISEEFFQRPQDFDLHAHMADSFGVFHEKGNIAIRIRFAPPVSRYVREKRWHTSQRIWPQEDGSTVVEFQLSGIEEIKHWILSFGALAEVLEPPELRRAVAEEAQQLSQLYQAELAQLAKERKSPRPGEHPPATYTRLAGCTDSSERWPLAPERVPEHAPEVPAAGSSAEQTRSLPGTRRKQFARGKFALPDEQAQRNG